MDNHFLIDEETSVSMDILPVEERCKVQIIVLNFSFFL